MTEMIALLILLSIAGRGVALLALAYSIDRVCDELRKIRNTLEDNKHGDD